MHVFSIFDQGGHLFWTLNYHSKQCLLLHTQCLAQSMVHNVGSQIFYIYKQMGASLIKDGRAQSNRPILIKVPKFLKNEKEYIGNPKGGLKICISIYNEIKCSAEQILVNCQLFPLLLFQDSVIKEN